ncbi:MAG: flagellar hook-length control protein FliK [Desulfobacteraceae bacterium]|nr:MAG: flagellar hook-length control protein FliK [Desulfobacteraceae bacterium]
MNMNMMIAGSILNFLLGGLTGDSKSSVREVGPNNFDSFIKEALLKAGEKNSALNVRTRNMLEMGVKRNGIYLKAFNDGLAAKGKSSDKAWMKSSDIDVLTDFLRQCGYTDTDADLFIGKLLEKYPDGMIPLSEFFARVETPEISGGTAYTSISLNPSVTPRLDSLLKDFGLTLEEADNTINAARTADGGLDLDKLITQLKKAGNRMEGEKGGTIEDRSSVKVSKKLEELGIQIQPDPATGRITIDDLVMGLEQLRDRANLRSHVTDNGFSKDHNLSDGHATGKGYDGRLTYKIHPSSRENQAEVINNPGQVPLNIKSSMDRIIERSVAAGGELELQLPAPSALQLKSASPGEERELAGTGYFSEGNRISAQVGRDGKPSINKQDNYSGRIVEAGLHEKSDRIAGLNEESGHKKEMNPGTDRDGSKTKAPEILQDGGYSSVRIETFSSVIRNRQAESNFFPEHVVEQLGNQISKSVMRGESVINLQLNPPELGAVKLSMEIKGKTLQLGMITESNSVKEIILAGAHELRSALLDQGIKLESMDIQVGQNFGRSLMNLSEGTEREHQQYQEANGSLSDGDEIQEDILPITRSLAERNYLLDLEA